MAAEEGDKSGFDSEIPMVKSERIIDVEANESLGNVVCYFNHIFIGTPKDFRIYEISTGDLCHKIEIGVTGMYSKRNLLLVALTDFRIILLNMKTKKPLGLLSGHTNWISSIGIYDDIVVTTSADKTAMVWNMGDFVVTIHQNAEKIMEITNQTLSCSKCGSSIKRPQVCDVCKEKYCDACSALGSMKNPCSDGGKHKIIIDETSPTSSSGSSKTSTKPSKGSFFPSEFADATDDDISEYAYKNVFTEYDDILLVLELKSSLVTPIAILNGHSDTVVAVGVIHGIIITASADRSLRMWTVKGKCVQIIESAHSEWIISGKQEGNRFYTLGRDNRIKQWAMDRKAAGTAIKKNRKGKVLRLIQEFTFGTRPFRMFVISNRLYVAMGDFSIQIYDIKAGKLLRTVTGHKEKVTSVISTSEQIFWSSSGDKKIKKWASDTGNILCVYVGHTAAINKIAFAGDKIVSAADDGSIRIWSRRDMEDRIRWYSSSTEVSVDRGLTSNLDWYASGKKEESKASSRTKESQNKKERDDFAWYM